jgi:hypothetical protein
MSKVRFIPFEQEHTADYSRFARESWGVDSHQGKPHYLEWLYRENPVTREGEPDFLLAVTPENDLVGAVHMMNLPWELEGVLTRVPAAHNLYVTEQYRTGTGLYLYLAMMKGQEHVFCPSQMPPLADTLSKLKWQEAEVSWYRRILSPASAALRLARTRLPGPAPRPITPETIAPSARSLGGGIEATATPDEQTIAELSASLQNRLAGFSQKPHWTPEVLRWRFFHPIGPRHLLIQDHAGQYLVLSLGQRHGLNTARIIEGSFVSSEKMSALVRRSERFLASNRIHVLLGYSADEHMQSALKGAGWRPLTGLPQRTFFYHRNKAMRFSAYAFNASAGDFGFEAIA